MAKKPKVKTPDPVWELRAKGSRYERLVAVACACTAAPTGSAAAG